MTTDKTRLLQDLLRPIEKLYASETAGPPEAVAMMRRAAAHLASLQTMLPSPGSGARMPACRYLEAAFETAAGGPLAEVAAAFAAAQPAIDWGQNPNYSAAAMGEKFVDRYCYTQPVGIGGAFENSEFLVGFILLGPDQLYPDHLHPAAEVYHVLSGHAEWWKEDRDWHVAAPGTMIYHPPDMRHAMRMTTEPLLALYCWGGEIATRARLTKPEEMKGTRP